MALILTNASMQSQVRLHASLEGLEARYTAAKLIELFMPHYQRYREFVSREGHPHFLTEESLTSALQDLQSATLDDALIIHDIGVELDGGTETSIVRLDPIQGTEIHQFGGSTGTPRYYRVKSDPEDGDVTIKVYPKPDQSYTYQINYLKEFDTTKTTYPVHGGWDKLPILYTVLDCLRRERDVQSIQVVAAEISKLETDIKKSAQRLSRRRSQRHDVNAYTASRLADSWGRYGR